MRSRHKGRLTYNDFEQNGIAAAEHARLSPRETEMQIRNIMYGASQREMAEHYDKFYKRDRS